MIVFKYFFDMKDVFGRKMDEMATRDNLEMEEVSLSVCLPLSLSAHKSTMLHPPSLLLP